MTQVKFDFSRFCCSYAVLERVGAAREIDSVLRDAGLQVEVADIRHFTGDWFVGDVFLTGDQETVNRVSRNFESNHQEFHVAIRPLIEPAAVMAKYLVAPVTLCTVEAAGSGNAGLPVLFSEAKRYQASINQLVFDEVPQAAISKRKNCDQEKKDVWFRLRAQLTVPNRHSLNILEGMFTQALPPNWKGRVLEGWRLNGTTRGPMAWARIYPGGRIDLLPADFDKLTGPDAAAA